MSTFPGVLDEVHLPKGGGMINCSVPGSMEIQRTRRRGITVCAKSDTDSSDTNEYFCCCVCMLNELPIFSWWI